MTRQILLISVLLRVLDQKRQQTGRYSMTFNFVVLPTRLKSKANETLQTSSGGTRNARIVHAKLA